MIITVVNQKGGVGKTFTACVLAQLFEIADKRVVVADMDTQKNSVDYLQTMQGLPCAAVKGCPAAGRPSAARRQPVRRSRPAQPDRPDPLGPLQLDALTSARYKTARRSQPRRSKV